MIRLSDVRIPCPEEPGALEKKVRRLLNLQPDEPLNILIAKRSLDARKKPSLLFIYTVDCEVSNEKRALNAGRNAGAVRLIEEHYQFPASGSEPLLTRPVVIGCGPAGLFAAYELALHGYRPLLLERGASVAERREKVTRFWEEGLLDPDTNVSFGEGGAGTFSDGKLNTMVKDRFRRARRMLETFVAFGAPEEILWQAKPHIGTDLLCSVIEKIRTAIEQQGGTVRFHARVTDFILRDGVLKAVQVNDCEEIPAQVCIFAPGHSARDTFEKLCGRIPMEPKAFAVGLRIEHPQSMINQSQYGSPAVRGLGAADYKLTHQASTGRGVYSFCMCPGGFVVNASTEERRLAINGMSNHSRDAKNANAALIVTVTPEDYPGAGPLSGVAFQRTLEEAAYAAGQGAIPVQLYEDFKNNRKSTALGDVACITKGKTAFANLRTVLPDVLSRSLLDAMPAFGSRIPGFDRPDALFLGIESRTSSPIRIPRDAQGESTIRGLYPCGEGAGYAGGITSAAMDGIAAAEKIAARFARPTDSVE